MLRRPLLVFAFLHSIAADVIAPTCYYDIDKPADPGDAVALPCSNSTALDAGEHAPCCFAGHVCMTHNACYDHISGNTYQYGCTDSSFQAGVCPEKCGLDTSKSPWVGLMKNGCQEDEWACNHPDNCGDKCATNVEIPWPVPPFALPAANCPDLQPSLVAFSIDNDPFSGLFTVPETLISSTSLTTSSGAPTSTQTMSTTSSTASLLSSSTSLPTAPTSSSTSAAAVAGIPTNTKIGIGVGAGVGGCIVLAALIGFFCYRRRSRLSYVFPGPPQFNEQPAYSGLEVYKPQGATVYKKYEPVNASPTHSPFGSPDRSELSATPISVERSFGYRYQNLSQHYDAVPIPAPHQSPTPMQMQGHHSPQHSTELPTQYHDQRDVSQTALEPSSRERYREYYPPPSTQLPVRD